MNNYTNTLSKTYTLCCFIFVVLVYSSCGQTNTFKSEASSKSDKINEIVSLYADYDGFNGSVLVAQEGEIIYKNGFGFAHMEWDISNQTDTKFQIASLTKSFTAMLIMQLVAENKLDLNLPISTYLPDYPKENGNLITIHHLLTHSSGLGRDASDDKKYNQPKDMVNQFANAPLQFQPGEHFKYSNSGYTLLGYIIETISKKPYEEVLKEKIFTPLKMNNSGYFRHQPLIKKMAAGYVKGFGDFFNTIGSDESSAYAAGAIYSTVEDLFLWDQALSTEILLPKKYMDLMFEKHIPDPSYNGHYGYGWELINKPIGNTSETVPTVGHSGSISGFRALYTRIPSINATVIFLNNTNRAFIISMTTAITGILHDKPYDFPKKPLAKFMSKVIKNEGIAKGIKFYKDHKDLDEYYVSETELIVAGYRFLQAGNAAAAAEVFKLSTEVFPDRDNPYDSYAEALKTLGKNKEAIINYKKSLQINPNNTNAIRMLKELGVDYINE
ncbi:serine hydrolase [Lacinutrix iliipiscaria]|uniref:Serine hydrolase n=1 Tax=Lacinutrix iliipiscaria TaxID=1230532 RepID=A0ABW5WLE8_9FLAO